MKNSSSARREIVEAGAGCGKTTGLVARYIEGLGYLPVDDGLKPTGVGFNTHEIFCLTFTIEASEQMKERILETLAKAQLDSIFSEVFHRSQISTIHSLCYRLLKPYLGELGYNEELTMDTAAHFQRKSFAIQLLSKFPDAEMLLKVMPLEELLQIVNKLWNSSTLVADSGKLVDRILTSVSHFENYKKKLLADAEAIAAKYNEVIAKSKSKSPWILELIEGLRENKREVLAGIAFRGFKEIREQEPAFLAEVESLRDFSKGLFWTSIDADFIQDEARLEDSLKKFILECRASGPKILDFSALEFETLHLLREKARSGERLCPPPKLLLVDEFQDTNPVQMEILELLSSDTTEWYFVGDPKQSIYAFRGSDVGLFNDARQKLKLLTLDRNYRSHPSILDFVNAVQNSLFDPEDPLDPPAQTLLVPKKNEHRISDRTKRVSLNAFSSSTEQNEIWAQLLWDLNENRQELGPEATHAALFRRWSSLREFALFLTSQGIGYEILGSEAYLDHLLTELFADFLSTLDNEANARAHFAINRWNLGLASLQNPAEHALKSNDAIEALNLFSQKVECRRFPRGAEWVSAMTQFLDALLMREGRYSISLADLVWILRKQGKRAEISIPITRSDPQTGKKTSLTLMTVHGSKGLQFDAVYLPELFDKRSQHQTRIAEFEDSTGFNFTLENPRTGERRGSLLFLARIAESERVKLSEQKRLFYVALTRPKEKLALYFKAAPLSRDESSLNSALKVLGWPGLNPCFWNDLLESMESRGLFQSLKTAQCFDYNRFEIEAPAATDNAVASESWIQPLGRSEYRFSKPNPHRMGVSRYLKLGDVDSKEAREVSSSEARPWQRRSSELGDEFHAILETWDGDLARLDRLKISADHRQIFNRALTDLRKLRELQDYWTDLKEGRVLREFGLFVIDDEKRLSGFADATWFPKGQEPIVIDWKSSVSMAALKKPERLEKIRRQLELYQNSLAKTGRYRPRRLAVGIELSRNPKVEVLFHE